MGLRQMDTVCLGSRLSGLQTETVLQVKLVVPTMAAVSHFN